MASGNIFKLLAEIKALKLDYEGAVKYLTDQGIEVVGIVKQGLDNFFKKIKARDPDFGNVVKELPIDDAGVPFNPNTLKSTPEKRGVENLFEETKKLPDVKMGSRINYQAIADKAGIDVELIRGKSWEEIMEIIKGKADGGRIGFKKGGKGRQDPMGGFAHQTAQEMREAAPDQFGGGMNISHGGNGDRSGGNKALVNNLNMSPVIESDYSLGFPVPTGNVGVQTLTKLGKIQAMLDFKNLLEGEDLEPELTYENQIGPLHIGGKFDTEGNKALGLGFNQGNLSIGAYTDLDDVNIIGLRYQKTFKDGGRANLDIGGRVGFVAGGWADELTAQGLSIYNTMTSGGHSDETIQNTLEELGYWPIPGARGIETIVNTDINQGGGGDGGGGGITNAYNPNQNLGTTNITDYEAEAYGIGPTWAGSWAKLKDDFSRIPTPFNLARMGINKFQDWRTQQNQLAIDAQQKAAAEKIAQEKIAAAEAAINRQASGAPAYNPTGEGNQTPGIGWNETGGPVSNRTGRGRTDWADGGPVGLATMFKRKR